MGGFKRFGLIFGLLVVFNALFVAYIGTRSGDTRYWLLMLMILSFMSFLYSGAYTLAVGAPALKRPLFVLVYHAALGLALYAPAVLLRELDASAALEAALGAYWMEKMRPQMIVPYAAYWLFLLPAVALSCYKQFRQYVNS